MLRVGVADPGEEASVEQDEEEDELLNALLCWLVSGVSLAWLLLFSYGSFMCIVFVCLIISLLFMGL